MKLINSYKQLGTDFFQAIKPEKTPQPECFLWNSDLETQLMLPEEVRINATEYFSGNRLLQGSDPIAQAYAGHQFGQYNPQLGDGRAHLLGELELCDGSLIDIQLKGSGRTRFSRRGDGKCALGPAIREFVMSEALNAMGVPSARTLAVVKTGESVLRTGPEPGAIVTRVADSHIRVGTFQYHAQSGNHQNLKQLTHYTIKRHFPGIEIDSPDYVIEFIRAVIAKQIKLIVEWMRIGFIHGVMNTDNTAISGETIDYGPCAMMGIYNPRTVYSSIDTQGRYCFGNQPAIMQWNMTRFAESLLPLIATETASAVQIVEPLIEEITEDYYCQYYQMMAKKLGLEKTDKALTDQLLTIMENKKLDYTQTFIDLLHSVHGHNIIGIDPEFADWHRHWLTQLDQHSLERMERANPLVIPRNHHVERVIETCSVLEKPDSAYELFSVLKTPYTETDETKKFQDLPGDGDLHYQTFCGT